MKKTIRFALLVVLLAVGGSLSAQTMINGGFKVMVLNNDQEEANAHLGFYAGFTQNVALSRHVGVAPGIYFSRTNGVSDQNIAAAGITYHKSLTENAIAVPVPMNVRIYFTDVSYMYIFAGPEFNVGITSKGEVWVDDSHIDTQYDSYEDGSMYERNRYNISWIGGVGAKFDILNIVLGASGNCFNRLYESKHTEKAVNVFAGIGLVF